MSGERCDNEHTGQNREAWSWESISLRVLAGSLCRLIYIGIILTLCSCIGCSELCSLRFLISPHLGPPAWHSARLSLK